MYDIHGVTPKLRKNTLIISKTILDGGFEDIFVIILSR